MVVPGGGLSPDGSKWIACRPRYFLTVEVLSALFRRLFLEMLVAAHNAGQLQFFGDHVGLADKAAFEAYLRPLHEIDWVVYAKEPFAGPEQVLRYLSRYTHRVAISNHRLGVRRREGRAGGRRVQTTESRSLATACPRASRSSSLSDAIWGERRWARQILRRGTTTPSRSPPSSTQSIASVRPR
jgi:Putative transposase